MTSVAEPIQALPPIQFANVALNVFRKDMDRKSKMVAPERITICSFTRCQVGSQACLPVFNRTKVNSRI